MDASKDHFYGSKSGTYGSVNSSYSHDILHMVLITMVKNDSCDPITYASRNDSYGSENHDSENNQYGSKNDSFSGESSYMSDNYDGRSDNDSCVQNDTYGGRN
jgi:hypothetical protein